MAAGEELDRLRSEVARLRDENAALSSRRHRSGWNGRAVASAALTVVAALLLPLAVVAFWGQRTLVDTQRYVDTVAPLAQDPNIRTAVGNVISEQLQAQVDLETRVRDLLPPQASPLAGPIASGVHTFIDRQIQDFLASDAFARLWVQVNTRAQQELLAALRGEPSGSISIQGSQVVLDTGVIADQVRQRLVDRGLTLLANVPVPPQAQRQIVLLDSPQLAELRSAYAVGQPVAQWLIYLVATMFVAAVLLARRRARAVLVVGTVLAAVAVLLRLGLLVGEGSFQSQLVGTPFELSARVFYATLTTYLMLAVRTLFVLGLVLCFAGWFAGRSTSAVTSRRWVATGLSSAGARTAGGRFGRFGQWVATHRTLLRVAVVVVAALVVVAQDSITGALLLWTLAAVLVALALVEFVGGSSTESVPGRTAEDPAEP